MDSFKLYSQEDILAFVNIRQGEEKLGERVNFLHSINDIESCPSPFVLLGIPEDIGVRANMGIAGAKTAWNATLKSLLNIQSNAFLEGDELLVLGHFDIAEPKEDSMVRWREKISSIDALVAPIVQKIVAAGKLPIIVGGGHNNAAPVLEGLSAALKQPINVVNIDAHADLRSTGEGRHSGNAFSYARERGHLNEYFVFGLHQNYMNKTLVEVSKNDDKVHFTYFDDLLRSGTDIPSAFSNFIATMAEPCGLEIDLDSISSVLSSAATPAGFNLNDIRRIILNQRKRYSYLHICEGAARLSDGRLDNLTGKTIAYLISDFIKALRPHISQMP